MDAVSDPLVTEIVVMKSAQIGWTEILNNVVGFHIHQDPSPILVLQPDLNIAETWSKDRFSLMVRDTPVLRKLIADPKARDSGNTILHKRFPGGHVTVVGANSPASLRSRPIRVLLCDEIDGFPPSAGPEGDPIDLARRRTATFRNRRVMMGSTPTVKGISRIEKAFAESDQRYFFVPCPDCGEFQRLIWGGVKFPTLDPTERCFYACAHCGVVIEEESKNAMVAAGEWRATKPFKGIAGFHISELYSTFSTWRDMAVAFLRAKKFPELLKTWVNTQLGETWNESQDIKDPSVLRDRAEDYALGEVPLKAFLIVTGVDVQGDRIEAYTWGFGAGEEAWCLDFRAFYGDPARPVVWDQLLEHLGQPLRHQLGADVVPRSVAIDSGGHHTQIVYAFCRKYANRRTEFGLQKIFAVKGQSIAGKPIIGKPTAQDVNIKGDKIPRGVHLWPVGSSTAKQVLYARLNIDTPGPGFVHTSKALPEDFWEQLVAERLVTRYSKGYPILDWHLPPGKRNEALDCAVYAYAAACQIGLPRMRERDWRIARERILARVAPAIANEPAESGKPAEIVTPKAPVEPPRKLRPRATRSNWTTGWR